MSTIKFRLECEMTIKWVPYFLGMLKRMQYLGAIGSSRLIRFYSDGDGNFRPRFEWDSDLPKPVEPVGDLFDTG